ncbi:biotin carboxylase [Burkholderia gladioli]|uniref:ATP-grasp domain-containing protein n=1 Tax=Burkholderia gladioli TaxID=28095 RepID=UPI001C22CC2F|nr:biotin carboxylase [Burkholderia gladioli]MBU9216795.1 biotin carboxylase [Burkholderia gladioli]MDN7722022.1 biotin carboxylase [Burkholderia gladioli]
MSELSPLLLIVDYNLTRVADVAHLAQAAKARHQADTILIRADPGARDFEICTHVIDLDPLAEHFVDTASERLAPYRSRLRAGLVFSDNAVQRGAELLERLGLAVDSAALAAGAFNKRSYRLAEGRARPLLEAQGLLAPASVEVRSVDDLRAFAASHPDGFVVKPSCEGNNRGVTIVRAGDSLDEAFDAVRPYLHHGAICETLIPYRREYSFDGVGDVEFVTEKLSASGKYPVEIAQILPARLSPAEQATLTRAGRLANLLVGQRRGAFHNEIKLSDDGLAAAVVEPNRRPAGMKIWTIAQAVYGIDFYAQWLDAAFGEARPATPAAGATQAATVMLGVPHAGWFAPPAAAEAERLLSGALARTASRAGLPVSALRLIEWGWLSAQPRYLPDLPRENGDFAAQVCIAVDSGQAEIRELVPALREAWLAILAEAGLPSRQALTIAA